MKTEVNKKLKTWIFSIANLERKDSAVLPIENGIPYTINGEVNSGKIEITY